MQRTLIFLFKNAPILLFSLTLLLVQLLFVSLNIIGLYLFGKLLTSSDSYKLMPIIAVITLLYDSTKVEPLGTWALSFSVIGLLVEVVSRILRIRNELNNNTLRSEIFLALTISAATIAQTYLLHLMSGESFAFSTQYSIVGLSILYIIIHKTTTSRNRNNLVNLL
jgi:cell shape-determining protein MreD